MKPAFAWIDVPARLDIRSVLVLKQRIEDAVSTSGTVLVLRAETDDFCLGLDLDSILSDDALDLPRTQSAVEAYADLLKTLMTAGAPTVVLLRGRVAGGGVGIAATCDYVLAAPDTRLALPELLHGFYPAIVAPVLLTRMSRAALRRMALEPRLHPVDDAVRWGLVDRVVAEEQSTTILDQVARSCRLLAETRIAGWKSYVNDIPGLAMSDALQRGVEETVRSILALRNHRTDTQPGAAEEMA